MNFSGLQRALGEYPPDGIVFVGLGNPWRKDDGVGIEFVEQLRQLDAFPSAEYIVAGTNPENYLGRIIKKKPAVIVFVDAARWGGAPGEVTWLPSEEMDPCQFSTHAYSMEVLEKYLKSEGVTAVKYLVVQPASTGLETALSKLIQTSLDRFFSKE